MSKQNILLYIVSGLITIILLIYLFQNLDWEILRTAFRNIEWGWFTLALLSYLISVLLRAQRFTTLMYSRQVQWYKFIPVSALHNILLYLLPAQTGDVTYIFIAKKSLNLSITEGTATLLAARFYDMVVVAFILAVLLPFSKNDMPSWVFYSAVLFCLITLLAGIAIFILLRFSKPMAHIEEFQQQNIFTRIRIAWMKFITGLQEIQTNKVHAKTLFLTAGIWLCLYLNHYFATQSIGLAISFYHIALISVVMIALTLIPVQGFANLGTHEIGWATVLTAFNYPYETALAIAVGTHFTLLISVLVANGFAFVGSQLIIPLLERET
ncbi:MAG: flippase-like domain-containing protein [Anaerolineales bacterium]|nr:flippase-like domain-containing protein [Anaerolineales bacterium]